jgi:phosphate acetyltransferase
MNHDNPAFYEEIMGLCKPLGATVNLPESHDSRVIEAAAILLKDQVCSKIQLFDCPQARQLVASWSDDLRGRITWFPTFDPEVASRSLTRLEDKQSQKGGELRPNQRELASENALYLAGALLHEGHNDTVVSGACNVTANVIRAGIQSVGLKKGCRTVSGSFFMESEVRRPDDNNLLLFADAGVVIEPTLKQLLDIATCSVETWQAVTPEHYGPPKVAFLSFSTKDSATHPKTELMKEASELFQAKMPEVAADGELQLDAALIPEVAARKAPSSSLEGRANILIFPDLNAANIGYKLTQRLGLYRAYGPILQGLSLPFSDLSRGAQPMDIVLTACINILRHPKFLDSKA